MTFDEYVIEAETRFANQEYRGLFMRRGQAYDILLHEVRPDIAARTTGTDKDPYYNSTRLEPFLAFVGERW